ncbi:MAG: M20 family metallopeptidase [Vulcanimicrobiota bacterium]
MRTVLLVLLLFAQALADPVLDQVVPGALEHYRWFHGHPELSNQEEHTAAYLAAELRKLGLEVETGIGGHGLVGVLRGQGPGPVVLYRADMDALPVTEATGLAYASTNNGVMHACGHDLHLAVALASLAVMARQRDWPGTILFVGQPAEEVGRGARAMLADPRLIELLGRVGRPGAALALHDSATMPVGQVAVTGGFVSANVDSVDILIHGLGGHGAHPETTVDPIVIGAETVLALQTIVSRKLAPGTRAVVTVGRFSAGTKHNIIPSQTLLQLTVRSYEDEVRARLLEEIEAVAVGVARTHGAPRDPEVTSSEEYTRAGYNDPQLTERIAQVFKPLLGPEGLAPDGEPSMGGEDFFEFPHQLGCPGMMFSLGAAAPESLAQPNPPGLHSDRWSPAAEPALRLGTQLMVAALREVLGARATD